MTGTLGYDDIRAGTVRQVAQLMAAAAITAPKSGGQLFLAGKPGFMETVIAEDGDTRRSLAAWMRARGKERRERIWFRDAEAAEAVDAILFIGLLPGWYPPNYDCGACGYATCAEFLHHTKTLRGDSAELEFAGPVCNLRDIDLGIAVGSAAKTAAIHSIDCRCQTRVAVAARKLGLIQADHAPSARQFLDQETKNHPQAVAGLSVLEPLGRAQALRARLLGILENGNEDPGRFRVTSRYVVATARRDR
jgi:uncharacterized ferredoxin-like protein